MCLEMRANIFLWLSYEITDDAQKRLVLMKEQLKVGIQFTQWINIPLWYGWNSEEPDPLAHFAVAEGIVPLLCWDEHMWS